MKQCCKDNIIILKQQYLNAKYYLIINYQA